MAFLGGGGRRRRRWSAVVRRKQPTWTISSKRARNLLQRDPAVGAMGVGRVEMAELRSGMFYGIAIEEEMKNMKRKREEKVKEKGKTNVGVWGRRTNKANKE